MPIRITDKTISKINSDNPRGGGGPLRILRSLPGSIWALGFVSMFMDISSESIHSLLPVFMVSVLGASMTTIGLIEGLAEAAAAISKVFSGTLSDSMRKRKPVALFGYGLAAVSKPLFPLADSISWVFTARFIDRIGKGIRGAPRDALVAELTPAAKRGAAYGLRQSLDSTGAIIGPLIAMLLMMALADNIRAVLWIAVIPAFIAVVVLVAAVHEPAREPFRPGKKVFLNFSIGKQLPLRYWFIVLLGSVFTLARFSEAFLVLRVQEVGLPLGTIPLVLIVMNIFYSATAYPAGLAADRSKQRSLLAGGLAVLLMSDVVLALASSPVFALGGVALWGIHMGLTQGLFAKLIADITPEDSLGTAFGFFYLITGIALLMASVIAGALWNTYGAQATFLAGTVFTALTLLGLLLYIKIAPGSGIYRQS